MTHPSDGLLDALADGSTAVAVVGLGYVGLPLAVCLAGAYRVIGYDRKSERIAELQRGDDSTGEVSSAELANASIQFSDDPGVLKDARVIIVAVPTPIDEARQPDLRPLVGASEAVAAQLQAGSLVIYESTVFPGCTEEHCVPVLEAGSGLTAGSDFVFGYSPERINPGDQVHRIHRITKVVSGSDAATLAVVAQLYDRVIEAGVHQAPTVAVAEAAKVIENTQRDLNIALVNELSLIFHRMGIDTHDVLNAAATKWNFLPFKPGLVGGHCIGVDPFYLTHKAEKLGYHPQVILAGRRINDGMGAWVAQECIRLLIDQGATIKGSRVLVLGLTFKEDCPDVRNTRVVDIVQELERFGAEALVVDPHADASEALEEYGVELHRNGTLPKADAIIAAVAHQEFTERPIADYTSVVPTGAPFLDVKAAFERQRLAEAGFTVWRL